MVLFHYLHLFVLGCFCLEMAEEVKVKRHTPFLPEDHSWPGEPEFGKTVRNLTAVANSTVSLRCPIGRVQDSAVSEPMTDYWKIYDRGENFNIAFYNCGVHCKLKATVAIFALIY